MDIVHLRRTCQYRNKILCVVVDDPLINRVFIRAHPCDFIIRLSGKCGSLLVSREQRTFCAAFDRHVGHRHPGRDAHIVNAAACKFQCLIGRAVGAQVADNRQNDVFCIDAFGQFTVNDNPNRLWNTAPHLTGAQNCRHLGITDTGREAADTAISGGMGVGAEDNLTRTGIAHLRHQLVTDTVGTVEMGQSLFFDKGVANLEVADILDSRSRNQMVINQDDLVRVPNFGEAHLFELVDNERNKNIVNHHPVDFDRHDLAGTDVRSVGPPLDDLFNQCMSHRFFLLRSDRCASASHGPGRLPPEYPSGSAAMG